MAERSAKLAERSSVKACRDVFQCRGGEIISRIGDRLTAVERSSHRGGIFVSPRWDVRLTTVKRSPHRLKRTAIPR